MAGLQAPTAEEGLELTAFSRSEDWTPEEPVQPSQSPSFIRFAQSRPSLSDSYDVENAEICTAAIRVIPRESTSDGIRLRRRDIKSIKIARRTLHATVVFGALTTLYQFVSLFPAFQSGLAASRGVEVQIQGQADSKQSLVYSFLKECEIRKNQNLPLSPDCEKYLAAYPKAPPGIETQVITIVAGLAPFPAQPTRVIKYDKRQKAALGSTSMVTQQEIRAFFALGCFALGYWSVERLTTARQQAWVYICTGALLHSIFAWVVVNVSKFGVSDAAELVYLFASSTSLYMTFGCDGTSLFILTYMTYLAMFLAWSVPCGVN